MRNNKKNNLLEKQMKIERMIKKILFFLLKILSFNFEKKRKLI